MTSSPTFEGFRAVFRRPSLSFAEIAWRWSLGASAAACLVFGLIEYFDALPVRDLDAALLKTRQPLLVGRALVHILLGSTLNRAVLAGLLAAFGLSVLWIVAASWGRMATVNALLEYFRGSVSPDRSTPPNHFGKLRSLIGLNFLRVVLTLAALLGCAGAAIFASLASPEGAPKPALAFLIFVFLAAVVCVVWLKLNWLLSVASIFVVRDGTDAFGAISKIVSWVRERTGAVFAISISNVFAHFAAFLGATIFSSVLLIFLPTVPARLVIGAVILVLLAYFAIVDWLYIARLAGYVFIVETPPWVAPGQSLPVAPVTPVLDTDIATRAAIDRDEPILSDIPGLAFEP